MPPPPTIKPYVAQPMPYQIGIEATPGQLFSASESTYQMRAMPIAKPTIKPRSVPIFTECRVSAPVSSSFIRPPEIKNPCLEMHALRHRDCLGKPMSSKGAEEAIRP